jgi:membrane fusion protein, heavy metal efflux system
VTLKDTKVPLVVEKSAVQYIDDQPCVFAHDGHAFEKRHVMLGPTDGRRIEITAGLQPGETIVTKNAFRIKSEMEKAKTVVSGHGHVH